jgi:hypothetical protein
MNDFLSPVVLLGMFSIAMLREVLELDNLFKHKSTPGRLVSSAHGLFVLLLICDKKWKDATEATFIYFCLDISYTIRYSWSNSASTRSILLHHILGFVLCAYSLVYETYDTPHFGHTLTRALLVLEVCNPVLHLSLINRYEEVFTNWIKTVLDCAMLLNYFYVRVLCLGIAVFETDVTVRAKFFTYPINIIYSLTLVLWCLQLIWFCFLVKQTLDGVTKKEVGELKTGELENESDLKTMKGR